MQQILILRIASLVFYLSALIVLVLEWYYKVETSRYLPYVNEHYEWFPLAIAAVAFICERTANKELEFIFSLHKFVFFYRINKLL